MITNILSIAGKPGLYKLVSRGRNMLIVESLSTGKRTPAYSHDKVMSLADIAIYTTGEDRPLAQVLELVKEKAAAQRQMCIRDRYTPLISASYSHGTTPCSPPASPSSPTSPRQRRTPRPSKHSPTLPISPPRSPLTPHTYTLSAMNIAIVGTGYVGLVSGTCFAEMGSDVTCIDVNKSKIDMLRQGRMPIYEPGLEELVRRNVAYGRLHFGTSLADVIDSVEVVFSAVGTPPDEDGSADLHYVLEVAREFGRTISKYTILVTKSTVPVGTALMVKAAILEELGRRGVDIPFDVASNPEFLKEGAAIKDFMSPDRVVVGVESDRARQVLTRLYKPFLTREFRVIFMDIPSAEMTKYAANAMLATRISFMNDIANLCELVGADVDSVRQGIGTDPRIGRKFLYAGCGYGGSCFPKDVKALAHTAREHGYTMGVIEAVEAVNERQKHIVYDKIVANLGRDIAGATVAVLGLAFKPETDDMREAPSLVVIRRLLADGATVRVFDPVAMDECRRILGDSVTYCTNIYDASTGADAIALLTEWRQFRMPVWPQIRSLMRGDLIVDGRNIYNGEELAAQGFRYTRIGRK